MTLSTSYEPQSNLFDEIRAACARVVVEAEHVRLVPERIAFYADTLASETLNPPTYDTEHHFWGEPDAVLAYLVTLDAVNFGSGYFPFLAKRPSMSGYFTVASHLTAWFEQRGAPSAAELANLRVQDCADMFRQPLDSEEQLELITLFAKALNDLGTWLETRFQGSFPKLIEAADGSAATLVQLLAEMPFFQDVSTYKGFQVPLYKRAQITASDLALAFGGEEFGAFYDLENLTIFADNLVPHVLKVDGVLKYVPGLEARIARNELIPAGSPEEVELRAVALHAVERLAEYLEVSPRNLDILLWNRGQGARYRAHSRHRTRTVFY